MFFKPRHTLGLSALLLLTCGSFLDARSQASANPLQANANVERWITQQVANNQDAAAASAFPDESTRVIRASFLSDLLTKPPKAANEPQTVIWISNVTVIGDLYLKYAQVPYDLYLLNFHFLGILRLDDSDFKRNFFLEGSTFEKSVSLSGIGVEGHFNLRNCHFNNQDHNPDQQVNLEYAKIGKDLTIEGAEFQENVSFLRSQVSQIFAAERVKFFNKGGEAKFEDLKVIGAFQIRKSQIDCAVNFLSASTGVFDASNAQFHGNAYFGRLKVTGDAIFEGVHFYEEVHFTGAEIGKDFQASSILFANCGKDADLFSMNIVGNARFVGATFAAGISLARTNISGNLELIRVTALSSRLKDFSVVKADNLILQGNTIAPPYSLNGMSYRLLFANQDELLRFLDGAQYSGGYSDGYKNLETYFQRQGNFEGAKEVHVAWKKRERSALGSCTLCLSRSSRLFAHPIQYLSNWVFYLTTAYGQHLELALIWSVGFIVAGYFVFRRRKWMDPTNKAGATPQKYEPLWYSIALFLPVVNLRDKDNWTPKSSSRRIYMRFHIIFGYLLIPIGLAAWTGIIK